MKQYAVIELTETDHVIWSQVNQTSAQTMRRNLANTQGLLSWVTTPSFITNNSLPIVGDIMNHEQALALLATSEWTQPIE